MFNFLKKLFKKEEIKEERVAINELEDWFNAKAASVFKDLDNKINLIKSKVAEEIKKTEENLGILETAKLQNPKISLREKQFMEGNREAYIKKVNSFLRQINLEGNYEELLQSSSKFDSISNLFSKSTFRPYQILQEFFANESRGIVLNIKNLDNLIKELKDIIKDANLDSIENLKKDSIQLKNRIRQKKENEEELRQKEKEKSDLIRLIDSIKEEIENLETSEESKKLNDLKVGREIILTKIRENNTKIMHSFAILERALKKYSRMILEGEKLLNSYIENPVNSLLHDRELKIIKILGGLEKNVLNNQIDLKDKKREKTLEEIRKLNKEFFDDFLDKNKELENGLGVIEEKIKENKIEEKINELKSKLEQKDLEMEKIDREIASLKDEISKVDVRDLKNELGGKIKSLLKIEIIIS